MDWHSDFRVAGSNRVRWAFLFGNWSLFVGSFRAVLHVKEGSANQEFAKVRSGRLVHWRVAFNWRACEWYRGSRAPSSGQTMFPASSMGRGVDKQDEKWA
jgi:hypothetical protein